VNVDDMTRQIDQRLAELREETGRLEQARAALAGGGRRRAGRPRSASGTSGARRGRRRGSGTRSLQALEIVKQQPGITIPELAERMGIKQNYLYRVLPGLQKDGMVRKEGRGWHARDAA
jgi:transposase-like protein